MFARVAWSTGHSSEKNSRALWNGKRNYLTAGYHLEKNAEKTLELPGRNATIGKRTLRPYSLYLSMSASSVRARIGASGEPGAGGASNETRMREWTAGVRCRPQSAQDAMVEINRALHDLK